MNIVLDTNVVVSAFWSDNRKSGAILNAVIAGRHKVCYDYRILEEYRKVLNRPAFQFEDWQIEWLLEYVEKNGISVVPDVIRDIPFSDERDRKFLEAARFCSAPFITGNTKHFPEDPLVVSVSEFYSNYF